MLKIYNTLDEVPEGLREHYHKSDGKYVPQLSDDHPVLVHNKTLLTEKSTATAKVKELEADIEQAKSTTVPRGHVAVAKADAELLAKFKALGEVDAVTAKLTEHETLKAEVDKRKREDNQALVAKELGYNVDAFKSLASLPDFEIREAGGKKTVVAKVKEGETLVEKDAKVYVESSYAALLPALQAKPGVTVPVTTGSGADTSGADPNKWAQDYAKNYLEQSQPVGDPFKAFNERSSAA